MRSPGRPGRGECYLVPTLDSVHGRIGIGARRDVDVAARTRARSRRVTSTVAQSSGLATSRLASVWERRSAAPDRPTPRWASPARKVFDEGQRSAAGFPVCCHGCFLQLRRPGTEPMPGVSSAGWGQSTSTGPRRVADDLPIAGRLGMDISRWASARATSQAASRCAVRAGAALAAQVASIR